MIAEGEFADCPQYVTTEMRHLAARLTVVSAEVSELIAVKAPRGWPTVIALTVACGAMLVAGGQTVPLGEPLLGYAEMVVAAGLAVWASLVRG
jgi:hypothetical protein